MLIKNYTRNNKIEIVETCNHIYNSSDTFSNFVVIIFTTNFYDITRA